MHYFCSVSISTSYHNKAKCRRSQTYSSAYPVEVFFIYFVEDIQFFFKKKNHFFA